MIGVILSKAANTYLKLSKVHGLDASTWQAFTQVEVLREVSIEKRQQVTWMLAEPNLAADAIVLLPNLKWLQSTWAGVERLLGIEPPPHFTLTNIKGLFAPLMSEYALSHLLAHERQLRAHHDAFVHRTWHEHTTGVIRGKTVMLLGVGSIGGGMAHAFKALGLRVIGIMHAPRPISGVDEVGALKDLAVLLPQADYVINILPLTPDTQDIFDATFFSKMAAHAVFMNVGRGQSVVEADLAKALRTGVIAAAVLDVYRNEPLPVDHVFWDTPHLTLTSHTAAPSLPEEVFEIFKDNLERFSTGQALRHVVDFNKGY